MNFNFSYSKETAWLDLIDAFVCTELSYSRTSLLEVGTYLGGFVFSVSQNCPNIKVTCVDPYPTIDNIKHIFLENVEKKIRSENWQGLYNSVREIPTDTKFDFIHIDGEHSEKAVLDDLISAQPYFSETPDLVFIVDDIFMRHFPGVTSGAILFAREFNFAPFLFTSKKLYFCRPNSHESMLEQMSRLFSNAGIAYRSDQARTQDPKEGFVQSNKVLGHSLIIIPNDFQVKKLEKFLNVKSKHIGLRGKLKILLPPFLVDIIRRLKSYLI